MPDRTLTRKDMPHAASDTVSADNAQNLYDMEGVDWAVSGDLTRTGYGTIGFRRNRGPAIWYAPGVRPKRLTTGIRPGDTITLHNGQTGKVTRVGTVAGFMRTSPHADETRWDNNDVAIITPATNTNTESN